MIWNVRAWAIVPLAYVGLVSFGVGSAQIRCFNKSPAPSSPSQFHTHGWRMETKWTSHTKWTKIWSRPQKYKHHYAKIKWKRTVEDQICTLIAVIVLTNIATLPLFHKALPIQITEEKQICEECQYATKRRNFCCVWKPSMANLGRAIHTFWIYAVIEKSHKDYPSQG